MEMKRIIMRNASLMKAFCCTYAKKTIKTKPEGKIKENVGQWDTIQTTNVSSRSDCSPIIQAFFDRLDVLFKDVHLDTTLEHCDYTAHVIRFLHSYYILPSQQNNRRSR